MRTITTTGTAAKRLNVVSSGRRRKNNKRGWWKRILPRVAGGGGGCNTSAVHAQNQIDYDSHTNAKRVGVCVCVCAYAGQQFSRMVKNRKSTHGQAGGGAVGGDGVSGAAAVGGGSCMHTHTQIETKKKIRMRRQWGMLDAQ